MRFRLCCTCGEEEKPKAVQNNQSRVETIESPTQTVVPEVISQQPKHVEEPNQLDRSNEVSVEESSISTAKEEQSPSPLVQSEAKKEEPSNEVPPSPSLPPPSPPPPLAPIPLSRKIEQKLVDISTGSKEDPRNLPEVTQKEKATQASSHPITQPYSPVNQGSNIRVDTTIGGEILTFSQIAPDLYRGTFKGSPFHIIQGNVQVDYSMFSESDKAAIRRVYIEAMKGMQRGMKELKGGVSALNDQEIWNSPPGSAINTNYFTRNGESAIMTFIAFEQGHFRSTYEGKEFTILNGRLLADDSFDKQDRELILQTYNNTLLGMQQGLLGMQQGMKMNIGASATSSTYSMADFTTDEEAFAHASKNLGTGRETLRKMHSSKQGKRRGLLEGVLMSQSRQPSVMVIEDITDEKPRNVDDVDGGKLDGKGLQKTTFTPQPINYDDPSTYEAQDKNELQVDKQLGLTNEYVISMDEKLHSQNRSRLREGGFNSPEYLPNSPPPY